MPLLYHFFDVMKYRNLDRGGQVDIYQEWRNNKTRMNKKTLERTWINTHDMICMDRIATRLHAADAIFVDECVRVSECVFFSCSACDKMRQKYYKMLKPFVPSFDVRILCSRNVSRLEWKIGRGEVHRICFPPYPTRDRNIFSRVYPP